MKSQLDFVVAGGGRAVNLAVTPLFNLDFRKYDSPRFGPADLPMSTTLADSTVLPGYLFDSGIPVSVKLVTTLRKVRTGPDKRVWRDERRVYVATNCFNGMPSN